MAIETEAQRQYYLGMAGIHCWYARSPQPGAAASPEFDFGEPAAEGVQPGLEPELPVSVRPDKRGQRKAGIASVRGLMTDSGPGQAAVAESPAPTAPESRGEAKTLAPEKVSRPAPEQPASPTREQVPSPSAGEMPADNQFVTAHWGFWSAGPWLLVSALSSDASHQLQEQLARNILKALAADVESTYSLQWPVFNNPAVAGNDRAGFRAVVQDLRREWPDQRLIALGLCQGDTWPDRSDWLTDALGEPAVDFEHSLPALATDPGRKRALWSRLRPLVASGG